MQYIKGKKKFIQIYTFFFLLISFCIFLPFILKGNTFVSNVDGYNQYYPVFVYIGKYIRECLNDLTIKQFDFTIGLGEGVIPALNYYGFGDPLNIFAALVPINYAPLVYTLLVILRLYLCGLCMAFCCRRSGKQWDSCCMAALAYAFSSFVLTNGLLFYTYITAAAILPLMITGINEVMLGKKKISGIFLLALFLQGINSFYFLYMDTLFGVVYFVVFSCKEGGSFKKFIKKSIHVLVHYIWGLCLSGVILLPSIWGFLSSTRTGSSSMSFKSALFNEMSVYKDYIGNLFIAKSYSNSSLAIPLMQIGCVILLLGYKRKKTEWRILCIISFIGYYLPIVGFVMNGFSYSTDRWVYILHFIFAITMTEVMEEKLVIKKKSCILFVFLFITSFLVHFAEGIQSISALLRASAYFILAVIVLLSFIKQWFHKKWLFGILLIGNIILNGFMINGPELLGGSGFSSSFLKAEELEKSFQGSTASKLMQSGSIWSRADVFETSYGAAMAMGFQGCAEYLSVLNKNISSFYQELDISSGVRGSSWTLSGIDGRKNLEDILSISEYLQPEKKGELIRYELQKNLDFLPLGFTYSGYITRDSFLKLNAPDKDIAILQAVILDKKIDDDWDMVTISGQSELLNSWIDYENIDFLGEQLNTKEESKIVVRSKSIPDGELYVNFKKLYYLSDFSREIQVENKILQVLNKDSLELYFGHDICDYWVKVDLEEEGKDIDIIFLPNKKYNLDNIEVYIRPVETDDYFREILREDCLENLEVSSNCEIEGSLSIDENKILFLSIPYSKGWTAYVNGEVKEIQRANVGFCGIPLKAGEYCLKLTYQTPGLNIGLALSLIAFAIWIINIIYRKGFNVKLRHS